MTVRGHNVDLTQGHHVNLTQGHHVNLTQGHHVNLTQGHHVNLTQGHHVNLTQGHHVNLTQGHHETLASEVGTGSVYFDMLPCGTGDFDMLPCGTGDFDMLPCGTGDFDMLPCGTGDFDMLPCGTGDFDMLPCGTGDFDMLPCGTGDFDMLPCGTGDFDMLPCGTGDFDMLPCARDSTQDGKTNRQRILGPELQQGQACFKKQCIGFWVLRYRSNTGTPLVLTSASVNEFTINITHTGLFLSQFPAIALNRVPPWGRSWQLVRAEMVYGSVRSSSKYTMLLSWKAFLEFSGIKSQTR
ncbi:unnamed protein product, partial [Coregonus sp. 'balchen']